MATKVLMEALSPTMEEGRLVSWHKSEGDAVKAGDVLAEVETDKAIMELVARADGVLRKRLIADGATAPVGQIVGIIAAPDENIDALVGAPQAAAAPAPPPSAAPVAAAAPAAAVPPVAVTAPAPEAAAPERPAPSLAPSQPVLGGERRVRGASPIPTTPGQSQGEASTPPQEQVPVVDRRAAADAPSGAIAPTGAGLPAASSPINRPAPGNGGRTRSSPLARRLASERGLDLRAIAGTGPNGRVVKRDVESAPTASAAASRSGPRRTRRMATSTMWH